MDLLILLIPLAPCLVLVHSFLFFWNGKTVLNRFVLLVPEIWHLIILPCIYLDLEWGPHYGKYPRATIPEQFLLPLSVVIWISVAAYFLSMRKQNHTSLFRWAANILMLWGIAINIWMGLTDKSLGEMWFVINLPIILLYLVALVNLNASWNLRDNLIFQIIEI